MDQGKQTELLSDPQMLNSYSYARNNPISYRDPGGKEPVKAYVGIISDFRSILDNSPRGVGSFTGTNAPNYMSHLGDVSYNAFKFFKPEPLTSTPKREDISIQKMVDR